MHKERREAWPKQSASSPGLGGYVESLDPPLNFLSPPTGIISMVPARCIELGKIQAYLKPEEKELFI